ncbi:hypothetical protein BHM03_00027187 [Ensete ventricosum]|nr:hypothetical protein BHM03_00027187 [Ensete ventricosum]
MIKEARSPLSDHCCPFPPCCHSSPLLLSLPSLLPTSRARREHRCKSSIADRGSLTFPYRCHPLHLLSIHRRVSSDHICRPHLLSPTNIHHLRLQPHPTVLSFAVRLLPHYDRNKANSASSTVAIRPPPPTTQVPSCKPPLPYCRPPPPIAPLPFVAAADSTATATIPLPPLLPTSSFPCSLSTFSLAPHCYQPSSPIDHL